MVAQSKYTATENDSQQIPDIENMTDDQWWELTQIVAKHALKHFPSEPESLDHENLESLIPEQTIQAITAEITPSDQPKKKRPLTINPIQDGYMPGLACLPVQGTIYAIQGAVNNKKGWEQKEGMGPRFKHQYKTGTTDIEYNPAEKTAEIAPAMSTSLWQEIEQFKNGDEDTLLFALAYLAKSKEQSTWVFFSDILNHRGIKPITKKEDGKERSAGHRKEDIEECARSFSRIANIWITIRQMINDEEVDKKTKKRKKVQYTHTARLFSIDEVWYQKEFNFDTGEYESRQALGIRIRAGDWLHTFLEFPNHQVASLCQVILKYDPHNEMWEKRLGYYFFFYGHFNKPQGGSVEFNRTVKEVLETNNIEINTRDPQRTRSRFEKSMNRLKVDGVINGWEYTEDIKLPSKRWLDMWLSQKISIILTTNRVLL